MFSLGSLAELADKASKVRAEAAASHPRCGSSNLGVARCLTQPAPPMFWPPQSVSESLASLEKSADQVLGYTTAPGDGGSLPSLSGLEHGGFLVGAPEEIEVPVPAVAAAAAPAAQPPPRADATPPRCVSPRSSGVGDEEVPSRCASGVKSGTTPREAAETPGSSDTAAAEPAGEESPRGGRPALEAEPRALLLTPTSLVSASVASTHRGDGGPADSAIEAGDADGSDDLQSLAALLAERTAQVADLQARLAQREAALERAAQAAGALAAAEASSSAHDEADVAQLQAKVCAPLWIGGHADTCVALTCPACVSSPTTADCKDAGVRGGPESVAAADRCVRSGG